MYYQEQVRNGVLCWRPTVNGEWTAFDAAQLTSALIVERARADRAEQQVAQYQERIAAAKEALNAMKASI